MSLRDYVDQKRALLEVQQKINSDRADRMSLSAYIFAHKKDQITSDISQAFALSDFKLQEDSDDKVLNFYNRRIGESARVTFQIQETVEAKVEINGEDIGAIHISFDKANESFIFEPSPSNNSRLDGEVTFEQALDKLILEAPFLDIPLD